MKCKINATGCPYHACMSDDCQRAESRKNGAEWKGDCEKQKTMETIEQAAFRKRNELAQLPESRRHGYKDPYYIDWFTRGVRWAQRWISVDEELPENRDEEILYLIRQSNGNVSLAGCYRNNIFWSKSYCRINDVSHWRLIELK